MYARSLQLAYQRCSNEHDSEEGDSPLAPFNDLCQRVAAAHAGFVSNAGDALGVIVHDGIDYVFEVPSTHLTVLK